MTEQKATNITWHDGAITRQDRERLLGQKGVVVWLTGLSGSGKSMIAHALEEKLFERGQLAFVLDGDNVRHGLNRNLGFSPGDRAENIRRIGELGKLFADCGVIVMAAFISPYAADRQKARSLLGAGQFIEVFVKVALDIAEERDPKGLYKKARAGEISEFTGISAPYEEPENAEIVVDTGQLDLEATVDKVLAYLVENGVVPAGPAAG